MLSLLQQTLTFMVIDLFRNKVQWIPSHYNYIGDNATDKLSAGEHTSSHSSLIYFCECCL